MARIRTFGIVAAAIAATTCGGGYTSPSPTPSPNNPYRVTISAAGAVLFINNDVRGHDMTSDPHPEHTDCPELNQVGLLTNGQSRESGNLVAVRTCGFHDHENPDNNALRGRIVVR
jgi:hypothetical protein